MVGRKIIPTESLPLSHSHTSTITLTLHSITTSPLFYLITVSSLFYLSGLLVEVPVEERNAADVADLSVLVHTCSRPCVVRGAALKWPAMQWCPEYLLTHPLGQAATTFAVHPHIAGAPPEVVWERQCAQVDGCLADLARWLLRSNSNDPHPSLPHLFDSLPHDDFWIYASYKYMALLFAAYPSALADVDWSRYYQVAPTPHANISSAHAPSFLQSRA